MLGFRILKKSIPGQRYGPLKMDSHLQWVLTFIGHSLTPWLAVDPGSFSRAGAYHTIDFRLLNFWKSPLQAWAFQTEQFIFLKFGKTQFQAQDMSV